MLQIELLRFAIEALERLNLTYMVVGSFASSAFGEPRLTHDIDIVLELPPNRVDSFCAEFPSPDYYLSEPSVREAVRSRFQFNVLHPASGNKIDFMFPRDDAWGRSQLQRRQRVFVLPDREGFAACPADVIIGKLWYYSEGGSEKHLRDITGMLRVGGDRIDRDEIARWASVMGYEQIWNHVVSRADASPQ